MSFLSLEFLALTLLTAAALSVLRGPARAAAYFAANVLFVSTFLDAAGAAFTASFVLAGYLAARLSSRNRRWMRPAIAVLVLVFVYARRYSFLELLLPERFLSAALSTAGLSFLLFKIVHVIVDAADQRSGPLELARFANYCLGFTSFLLGPIQRYQDFNAQWDGRAQALPAAFEPYLDAVNRILRGLVKKYVVAEMLRPHVLSKALDLAALSPSEILLATYAFYFFLYFDFSGYCDIVIGAGSLVGVRPPENFDLPFLAPNIAQFWLRVHKSLTLWLTDYVFNPLFLHLRREPRFAAHPLAALNVALVVTMLVSGLWHGTTLGFLLFGLVHGAYLIGFRIYEHVLARKLGRRAFERWRATWISKSLGVLLTFNATAAAYAFFVLDGDRLQGLFLRMFGP